MKTRSSCSCVFSAPNEHENLNSAAISAFGVGVGIGGAVAIGKRFFRIAISNSDPDGLSFLLFSKQLIANNKTGIPDALQRGRIGRRPRLFNQGTVPDESCDLDRLMRDRCGNGMKLVFKNVSIAPLFFIPHRR
jgi:hypothetical protein